MSHKPQIVSPPGTPLLECTVGELVAERPGRSRIFQAHGIDFCCQGGRTLSEACARKGVSPHTVVEQLEAEVAEQNTTGANPADLPLDQLANHIINTHHAFLRSELPRLHAMSERVAHVHGGHTPSLIEVFDVFCGLEDELKRHIMKEERILFPFIVGLTRREAVPVRLDEPIACMIHEHEEAGAALLRLRDLTNGFEPPMDACNTYRALFAGLKDLEADLHVHIHLENSVLFPGATALTQ